MTPDQRLIAKWVAIFLFLIGVFFSGFGVRGYMAGYENTRKDLAKQQEISESLKRYADDLSELSSKNLGLQAQITALDAKHTETLDEKLAENSALRRDLVVAQRMRLQGTTCPKASTGSDVASGPSMGDGAGVELSAETGLAVWDLRESIIRDQAKLAYLQEE